MRVPLAVPNLSGREGEYLQECVTSTFVSTAGAFVTRFENEIAAISGTETAVATCSGTVALQMALEGLGIGAGDLVMVPSLTFIASTNAITHSGATPWLVDVSADTWTIDLDLARHLIETETEACDQGRRHRSSGQVLRAIMPVMTMGASLDFDAAVSLAGDYGLKVVVDAAAAIGAFGSGNRPIGATGVDAVCYSFNGNKTVTTGGGGALAADDADLVERIRHLITTGRPGPDYDHDVVAYNFRITNLEAAVGVAQLERLGSFLERKSQVYERYREFVSSRTLLDDFPTPQMGRSVHWFSGIYYRGDDPQVVSDFRAFMQDKGIDVRPFWKPVHLQVPYRDTPASLMKVSEEIWWRIVPLPASTGITDAELDYVIDCATEFWDRDGLT